MHRTRMGELKRWLRMSWTGNISFIKTLWSEQPRIRMASVLSVVPVIHWGLEEMARGLSTESLRGSLGRQMMTFMLGGTNWSTSYTVIKNLIAPTRHWWRTWRTWWCSKMESIDIGGCWLALIHWFLIRDNFPHPNLKNGKIQGGALHREEIREMITYARRTDAETTRTIGEKRRR